MRDGSCCCVVRYLCEIVFIRKTICFLSRAGFGIASLREFPDDLPQVNSFWGLVCFGFVFTWKWLGAIVWGKGRGFLYKDCMCFF